MVHTIIIEPRYQETDQMGVIHHSVYPIWYEMGRVKFCEAIGLPFHVIEVKGVKLALYHLEADYIRPALFGEIYRLKTKLIKMTQVRIVFIYELFNDEEELIHRGHTELIWLNDYLKPTNVEKTHPDIYQAFIKEVEE